MQTNQIHEHVTVYWKVIHNDICCYSNTHSIDRVCFTYFKLQYDQNNSTCTLCFHISLGSEQRKQRQTNRCSIYTTQCRYIITISKQTNKTQKCNKIKGRIN